MLQNLQIKAHLLTPIALTDEFSPSLDGLLVWLWLDERGLASPNVNENNLQEFKIPLAQEFFGDRAIFKTSAPFYSFYKEAKDRFRKRWEPNDGRIDWGKRKPKFDTSQGKEKAYDLPIYNKLIEVINWCCVGDKAEIEHLLSRCHGLGKKRSHGFGQVERWEVVEIEEDWSFQRDGKLMRPIPFSIYFKNFSNLKANAQLLKWGFYPPYWFPQNQDLCAMPSINRRVISPIKLKNHD